MKFLKLFLLTTLVTSSVYASTKVWPSRMSKSCEMSLLQSEEIRDGSVQAGAKDIVAGLKYLWRSNPAAPTVTYDECGSSDFYTIEIDKATCKVLNLSVGDSDGECGPEEQE